MTTYEIIISLCEQRNIAPTALEKELGFGNGYIGKLKTGGTSANRLQKIADYFNVPYSYLLTGEKHSMKTEEDELNYDNLLKIYTRGKNNLTPEEKIKLAQIILSDRNDQ